MQALELTGALNEEQSECLRLMERNASALSAIIDQMLDVGGVDGGRGEAMLDRRPVLVPELMERAVDQVRALSQEKGQRLACGPPGQTSSYTVMADADKTVRVLVNLLANAVKFTQRGGYIRLKAFDRADGFRGPAVCFEVTDNGPGIAPEHLERIFEEGFRVDASGITRRSTGLGLTFCKRIAEAHGGRIEVESSPGEGSVFRVFLPVK